MVSFHTVFVEVRTLALRSALTERALMVAELTVHRREMVELLGHGQRQHVGCDCHLLTSDGEPRLATMG